MSSGEALDRAWASRVASGDWDQITEEMNQHGGALLPQLLTREEAVEIREMYRDDAAFRSTIVMERYRFGQGEYRYFNTPLPEADRAVEAGPLPETAPDRARLVCQAWPHCALAGDARRMA